MPLLNTSKTRLISFLRRIERITKTDNVYLAKNASLLIFTQGINVLNGFVLYLLISHFLPKETYGQYKYFLSLFSLFSLATFTGVDISVSRAVANGNDGAVMVGFKRKLAGGAIGSLCTLLAAGYYLSAGRHDLALALVLLALFAPWIYAANLYSATLSGKKLFPTYTKINIATSTLGFVGMAAAFLFLRDPVWLFAAFLLTSSTVVIAFAVTRRTLTNTRVGHDTLSFATHLSKLDLLGTIANSIDSILVFHFLGAPSLAIYSFATIPVEQMKGFLKSIPSIAMPKFTTGSLESIRQSLGRKIGLFMLIITGLMSIYIMLAPHFFRALFPAYIDAVPYSQVYSLSLIFTLPATLLVTMFMAQGLRRETTRFNVINYSVQIILLIVGSLLYGLWGAIFARLIARTLMFFTSHTMLKSAQTPAPVSQTESL